MNRRLNAPCQSRTPVTAALVLMITGLGLQGCSSISETLAGNKVDYRTAAAKAPPVEVPPDLTQLQSDARYQPVKGDSVSASALLAARPSSTPATATTNTVAPKALDALRVERAGTQRWLVSPKTPEQLWPQLRTFWEQAGFKLAVDKPDIGIMETEWSENRAKIQEDLLRRTIGRVLDKLYDTGERDLYRTRVERTATGTEIYVSHRGMIEIVTGNQASPDIRWHARPSDPELEAEHLAQLMVALRNDGQAPLSSASNAVAKSGADAQVAAAASTSNSSARARVLEHLPVATLQVDDDLDRAWRRVGLALDRGGFTVEDRDRKTGLYFVRYVDPKLSGQEEPNIFARLFGAKRADLTGSRYQVRVASENKASALVTVLDDKGVAQNTDVAKSIVKLLQGELR